MGFNVAVAHGWNPFRRWALLNPSDGWDEFCIVGKVAERLARSWEISFALVKVSGPGGGGVRFGEPVGRCEDASQIEQNVGVLAQKVGLRGERFCGARQFLGCAITATVGE